MVPSRAPGPNSADDYLAQVPPKFRTALQHLRLTIRASAPGADEVSSYQMPAFRLNGMLVYDSTFSDHCSFFLGSARLYRKFSKELKPFRAGKGTLQFTPERPLLDGLVWRLVKARVAENAERRRK